MLSDQPKLSLCKPHGHIENKDRVKDTIDMSITHKKRGQNPSATTPQYTRVESDTVQKTYRYDVKDGIFLISRISTLFIHYRKAFNSRF